MTTPTPTWITEHGDYVAERWLAGHSASMIAAEIGVSRSAIIGFVHRRNIARPITRIHDALLTQMWADDVPIQTIARYFKVSPATISAAVSRLRLAKRSSKHLAAKKNIQSGKPKIVEVKQAEVDPLLLRLIDLRDGMCRYPYGDRPYLFCGQPCEGTYCAAHHALCYEPVSERRQISADRNSLWHARRAA